MLGGTEYLIRVGGWEVGNTGVGDLEITFSDLLPVSNLICTPDNSSGINEVTVAWDEDIFYDNVNLYLDVVDPANLIATVPGGGAGATGSVRYAPAADGGHSIIVAAEPGGALSPPATRT